MSCWWLFETVNTVLIGGDGLHFPVMDHAQGTEANQTRLQDLRNLKLCASAENITSVFSRTSTAMKTTL